MIDLFTGIRKRETSTKQEPPLNFCDSRRIDCHTAKTLNTRSKSKTLRIICTISIRTASPCTQIYADFSHRSIIFLFLLKQYKGSPAAYQNCVQNGLHGSQTGTELTDSENKIPIFNKKFLTNIKS